MAEPERLWCTVLGPVRAWRGETEIDLGSPQQRAIFGLLLLHAGQPMRVAEIVDGIWGDNRPTGAVNAVHRCVGLLRRCLEPGLALREPGRWLLRSASGYRLAVDADSVDLLRFRHLAEQVRTLGADRPEDVMTPSIRALQLWQDWGSGGVSVDLGIHPSVTAVHREYLSFLREAADLALASDSSELLLAAVELAAARNPLDEPLHARLVLMLGATGRQAQALDAFRTIRDRLVDELGLDPGPELAAARDSVLQPGTAPTAAAQAAQPRPAQLPADLPTFTGRRAELTAALAMRNSETAKTTVIVTAIGGSAGIGKTTFAIHWASQIADQFPDGQLYVNLRGFEPSGQMMSSSDALQSMLAAFGTAVGQIPPDLDARASLFRTVTAGRRILLVLDNARDAEQVRPLLPGSPGCLVIITSRNQLAELSATHSAHLLSLDVLPAVDAEDFLGRRIGAARLAAEPDAVTEIVAFCGGLPLALAIVAARAVAHPNFALATLAAELRTSQGSLNAFAGPGAAINARAVFSWSLATLTPAAADLFRLLGVHPGPDIDAAAVASLAGTPRADTLTSLSELQRAHLLTEHAPGRYTCHDLLRAYAAELVDEAPDSRDAARARLADHYLHTAWRARLVYVRSLSTIAPPPIRAGVRPTDDSDAAEALSWFVAHESVLLNMVAASQRWGLNTHLWQLAWAIYPYMLAWSTEPTILGLQEMSVDAAHHSGDRLAYARCLTGLAIVVIAYGQPIRGLELLRQALAIFVELDDHEGQARVHLQMLANRDDGLDPLEARYHADRALSIYQALDDPLGMIQAGVGLAQAHLLGGDHHLAIDQACRTLSMVADEPADSITVGLWDVLTRSHAALGDWVNAIDSGRTVLDYCRRVAHRNGEANALNWLGDVQEQAGDMAAARQSWQQAIDAVEGVDHPLKASIRAKLAPA